MALYCPECGNKMKAIDRKHKRDHLKVCRKCLRKDETIVLAGKGYNQ